MKTRTQICLLLYFIFALVAQAAPATENFKWGDTYIPESLDDCVRVLNENLPEGYKKQLLSYDTEFKLTSSTRMNLGSYLRSKWQLDYGSTLANELRSQGVIGAKNMSELIIAYYWRDLKGQPMTTQDVKDSIAMNHAYFKRLEQKILSPQHIVADASGNDE